MALLSTRDSNDSQKHMRAVLTIHPTLAYPFFSLIRPLFLRVLPKGGRICEGLLYKFCIVGLDCYLGDSSDPSMQLVYECDSGRAQYLIKCMAHRFTAKMQGDLARDRRPCTEAGP